MLTGGYAALSSMVNVNGTHRQSFAADSLPPSIQPSPANPFSLDRHFLRGSTMTGRLTYEHKRSATAVHARATRAGTPFVGNSFYFLDDGRRFVVIELELLLESAAFRHLSLRFFFLFLCIKQRGRVFFLLLCCSPYWRWPRKKGIRI